MVGDRVDHQPGAELGRIERVTTNSMPRFAATSHISRTRTGLASPLIAWSAIAILITWFSGGCYQLYRLLEGFGQIRRLLRTTRPVVDARTIALAEATARSSGIEQVSRLVPVAMRVRAGDGRGFSPRIVLSSQQTNDLTDNQWRFLLLHETAHIKRRDLLVGLLQRAALVIYWWNPLVHRVSAALTQTREQICDDLVTQHTRHADGYAALIVEFASRVVNRSIAAPVLGVTDGSTKDLTLRIHQLYVPSGTSRRR